MRAQWRICLLASGLSIPASLVAQGTEFRLGVFLKSSDRNVSAGNASGQASTSLQGAVFLMRNDFGALSGSYGTGSFSSTGGSGADGPLREARVGLGLGPKPLTFEGGYYRRARGTSLSDHAENLFYVGARSSISLGPSGFVIGFAAAANGRKDSLATGTGSDHGGKFGVVGWNAETSVLYQAPRGLPFYASLGYRFERFRSNINFAPVSHEEISGIVFGIGLRYLPKGKAGGAG